MRWDFIFTWFASRAGLVKKGIRHDHMNDCLNCGFELGKKDLYCPECGQKVHFSTITVWSLLTEFFAGIFNVESSPYRSVLNLPRPGYLTKRFMQGRRKRYLNPIRFFLVALIVHIAVITNLLPIEQISHFQINQVEELGQERLRAEFTAIKDSLSQIYGPATDSLERIIFDKVDNPNDSISVNGGDSTGTWVSTGFNFGQYKFNKADFFDMPVDEFLSVYEIENYWERVVATQALRAARDPAGAITFAIGNLLWIIFSLIMVLGLFMKLLYIRRNRFYVEHLILLFNVHTFSFLIASLGLWVGHTFIGSDNDIDDIAYLMVIIYFFLSIKFYYGQGWIKSLIKFALISFVYIGLLIFMIAAVSVISFMLF